MSLLFLTVSVVLNLIALMWLVTVALQVRNLCKGADKEDDKIIVAAKLIYEKYFEKD